jgi:hypothetical protein
MVPVRWYVQELIEAVFFYCTVVAIYGYCTSKIGFSMNITPYYRVAVVFQCTVYDDQIQVFSDEFLSGSGYQGSEICIPAKIAKSCSFCNFFAETVKS